ncbi:hypothetical protein [Larkinella knui]
MPHETGTAERFRFFTTLQNNKEEEPLKSSAGLDKYTEREIRPAALFNKNSLSSGRV